MSKVDLRYFGGSFNAGLVQQCVLLVDPRFFCLPGECRVSLHSSSEYTVECDGEGLHPLWRRLLNLTSEGLCYSINTTALLMESFPGKENPFSACFTWIGRLSRLAIFKDWCQSGTLRLRSGDDLFIEEWKNGEVASGVWALGSGSKSPACSISVEMAKSVLPDEAFSHSDLKLKLEEFKQLDLSGEDALERGLIELRYSSIRI